MTIGQRPIVLASVAIALSAVAALAGCQKRADEKTVTIFAAASTIDVMVEVLGAFPNSESLNVRSNFASSATLANLLLRGSEADLFLSANREWATKVANSFEGEEVCDLLSNRLVVIARKDSELSFSTIDGLANSSIKRVALGDPASVPAGVYAKSYLQAKQVWTRIESKVAATADVRQALALVIQGAAEVGIVYSSDILGRDEIKVLMTLDDTDLSIVYPLVRFRSGNPNPTADELFEFMQSEQAAEIFARHGFQPLVSQGNGRTQQ